MNFSDFNLYQIIIGGLAALMILQSFVRFAKGESGQTFYKFLIRLVVWGGMATIVIYPRFTNTIADLIGIRGNINAVVLVGFLLTFLMIFKLLSAIERLEQNISKLTRKEAIKEIERDEK